MKDGTSGTEDGSADEGGAQGIILAVHRMGWPAGWLGWADSQDQGSVQGSGTRIRVLVRVLGPGSRFWSPGQGFGARIRVLGAPPPTAYRSQGDKPPASRGNQFTSRGRSYGTHSNVVLSLL